MWYLSPMSDDRIERTAATSRLSQCDGKVTFKHQRRALEAAERRDGRIVYRCPHCFHWHVGTPDPKIKKFAKRKKLIKLFLEPEWTTE